MIPKIQLALDLLDGDKALAIAQAAAPYVDIIEAGTPLIKSVGIRIVTRLKNAHPDKIVLADTKTSDVGAFEANMAFSAGADIVTTQGITTLATIEAVQKEADRWGRRAEVDMTGVGDPVARSRECQAIGVSLVLYHRSVDEELSRGAAWDETAVHTVRDMCDLGLDVAIAGGVNPAILTLLRHVPLYTVIIGRSITAQPDPTVAASAIRQQINQNWSAPPTT